MKRLASISLIIALIVVPAIALAKTWTIDIQDSSASFQVTTFEQNIPEDLQAALDENGFAGRTGYCGALMNFLQDPDYLARLPENVIGELSYSVALLALEDGSGGRTLVGMVQSPTGSPWEMNLTNAGVLIPGRNFSITFTYDSVQLGDFFEIVYPREGGGTERYGMMTDRYLGKPYPWLMRTYASVDDAGMGFAIDKSRSLIYGFQVADVPRSEDFYEYHNPDKKYDAFVPFWVDYIGGLQNYPTTEEEIKAISKGSWDTFLEKDPAFTLGCNLREKPTTRSKTLGMYNGGVRLTILEHIYGGTFGWYRVRIGDIEGYMSANYVYMYDDTHFQAQLQYVPLPIVCTTSAQALLQSPGGNDISQLPQNTYAQVLAESEDGWLHVSVPEKGIRWQIDPDAPTGYLRKRDVYTLSVAEHALVGQP